MSGLGCPLNKNPISTRKEVRDLRKKAILVACPKAQDYQEALALCETAELEVVATLPFCRSPHPATYIGPGRLNRLKEMVEEEKPDIVVIFGNPKPSQLYRIMKELNLEVWDRTSLILKIFELHSGSKEAKLQTELARLKYELTLAREYIRNVKKGEQVHFLGPGEYAVEYVIRAIHKRMKKIERELDKIKRMRENQKKRRAKRLGLPEIAITGYTCAGKTALINALSRLGLKEGPEMFTTIMPKHTKVWVDGKEGIFIDTVGFIEGIPPQIIEAFHATLAEILYSDLALLVVDGSVNDVKDKMASSLATLAEIGYTGRPLMIAVNKVDLLEEYNDVVEEIRDEAERLYPWTVDVIPISAKTGFNIKRLAKKSIDVAEKYHKLLDEMKRSEGYPHY